MENGNALKLDLTKEFNVPADRLYQAWIAPDELKQWWHSMGNTLQHATTTPQAGGPVEYVFTAANGEHSFTIKGQYKEVEAGKRLVYTWNWELPVQTVGNSEFLLTVVFNAAANGSQLAVTQENFTEEESVQPHRDGWEKALEELHQFLSKQG